VFFQGRETRLSVTPEHRNMAQREIPGAKRKRHENGGKQRNDEFFTNKLSLRSANQGEQNGCHVARMGA